MISRGWSVHLRHPQSFYSPLGRLQSTQRLPNIALKSASVLDYNLPHDRIATKPVEPRSSSRMLVVREGRTGSKIRRSDPLDLEDKQFLDLPSELPARALLIANDSKVVAARLFLRRPGGRGEKLCEVLCLSACQLPARGSSKNQTGSALANEADGIAEARHSDSPQPQTPQPPSVLADPTSALEATSGEAVWECLVRGKKVRVGEVLHVSAAEEQGKLELSAEVVERRGKVSVLRFSWRDPPPPPRPSIDSSLLPPAASSLRSPDLPPSRTPSSSSSSSSSSTPVASARTATSSSSSSLAAAAGAVEGVGAAAAVAPPEERTTMTFGEVLSSLGHMPLPPYLKRAADEADAEDYQTVYASPTAGGSVAAPTAGLHFDHSSLAALKTQRPDVAWEKVTLHVGAGTFAPLGSSSRSLFGGTTSAGRDKEEKTEEKARRAGAIGSHAMHAERIVVKVQTLDRLIAATSPLPETLYEANNNNKGCGGLGRSHPPWDRQRRERQRREPVVCVGTTSLRTVESLYWLGLKCLIHEIEEDGAEMDASPPSSSSFPSAPPTLMLGQWEAFDLEEKWRCLSSSSSTTTMTTTTTSSDDHPSLLPPPPVALNALKRHCTAQPPVLASTASSSLLPPPPSPLSPCVVADTRLMVLPGYQLCVADALLTNFHQPKSSLLLLVAALLHPSSSSSSSSYHPPSNQWPSLDDKPAVPAAAAAAPAAAEAATQASTRGREGGVVTARGRETEEDEEEEDALRGVRALLRRVYAHALAFREDDGGGGGRGEESGAPRASEGPRLEAGGDDDDRKQYRLLSFGDCCLVFPVETALRMFECHSKESSNKK